VDQRSDLYSLGAVAYFALLGRPPFDGATPEAILARQTTDDLPPLHASRGDVPREFEEVLRRAMTGDPAARYASAQQFRQAVRKSQGFLRRLVVFLRGD
jgi:serine/threonine-protein kinase